MQGRALPDAIAVTTGPGLMPALMVGVETSKALGYAWKRPVIAINHIGAHILSNWIDHERFYPREEKATLKKRLGIDSDTKVIFFIHHLSERKGADLISPIAAGFGDENVLFLVAGKGIQILH